MNNRGQAMIESLVVGLILMSSLFFFLRYAFIARQSLLIDELIEQTLICVVSRKTTCIETFRNQLIELRFSSIVIGHQSQAPRYVLKLSATSSFNKKIEKESELFLDLEVR